MPHWQRVVIDAAAGDPGRLEAASEVVDRIHTSLLNEGFLNSSVRHENNVQLSAWKAALVGAQSRDERAMFARVVALQRDAGVEVAAGHVDYAWLARKAETVVRTWQHLGDSFELACALIAAANVYRVWKQHRAARSRLRHAKTIIDTKLQTDPRRRALEVELTRWSLRIDLDTDCALRADEKIVTLERLTEEINSDAVSFTTNLEMMGVLAAVGRRYWDRAMIARRKVEDAVPQLKEGKIRKINVLRARVEHLLHMGRVDEARCHIKAFRLHCEGVEPHAYGYDSLRNWASSRKTGGPGIDVDTLGRPEFFTPILLVLREIPRN